MTYVFFDPDFEGPNNLRLSLTFALTLARLLNRTLVLPPPLPVLHWDWGARPSEPARSLRFEASEFVPDALLKPVRLSRAKSEQIPTMGVEPTIFRSGVGRLVH